MLSRSFQLLEYHMGGGKIYYCGNCNGPVFVSVFIFVFVFVDRTNLALIF